MDTILTKTVKAGTITAVVALDGTSLVVTYNGEVVCKSDWTRSMPPMVANGITYRYLLANSQLVLTDDEYRLIETAKQDAIRNRPRSLREQRDAITGEIVGLRDWQDEQYQRRHDRQDASALYAQTANEPAIAGLRAKLATFDAAHPEVLAEIKAERAVRQAELVERAERNRWN